ncbi:MAG TPA: antibiotic biosynthesis monooxygenase [Mycobacteriales bacterium]|nr:antibiotic biosynthesis monooxygenase [Mycobacteriales bacterium]
MSKVAAITRMTPKPGMFEQLCACAEQMAAAVAAENGTEVYVVSRSTREPEVLFLFELFTDSAALKAHAAAGGAVGELVAPYLESIEVVRGEPLVAKGVNVGR